MSDWLNDWRSASGVLDEQQPEPEPVEDTASTDSDDPGAAAPSAVSAPDTPRKPGRRRRSALYPLAALVAAALIAVIAVLALSGGGDNGTARQSTIAIPDQSPPSTTATSSLASPVSCTATDTETRLITNGPGDTHTAPGLIAAFEHAYFAERDSIAAAEHLDPQMRVTATAIKGVMDANFPPGADPVPYCATITPWNDPDTWAVSVDWVDKRTNEVKTWTAVYEVKTVNGQLRITAQRDTQ